MSDPELEAIRSNRMKELQQQQISGLDKNDQQQQQAQAQQEAAARDETMRNSILSQVLDQDARARLSNIAAAKPEKAKMLENMIIQMARYGQISGKLGDEQLKGLLDKVSEKTQRATTVKFNRRCIDSDSD